MAKLIINGKFRSSPICMKVTGYYVSMIMVSVINNPDKKIFVNNSVILSLINFNLFLLNT